MEDLTTCLATVLIASSATLSDIQDEPSNLHPVGKGQNSTQQNVPHPAVTSLRVWLDTCEALHGSTCHPEQVTSRFLVDLRENGQIISTTENAIYRYAALSYHWQGQNGCNLTAQLRCELWDCESLFYHQQLPYIVHQTMRFVRELGERYLWVDFLCLAHGEDDFLQEVKRMDKIYAGALFTIITACGSGLQGTEPGRSLTTPYGPTGEISKTPMVHHYETLLNSAWAKRGWTFQERMFSKRATVFFPQDRVNPDYRRRNHAEAEKPDHCFFWECECAMWDNWDLQASKPMVSSGPRDDRDPKYHTPDSTTGDYARYLETVYHYNTRVFTNPQDTLRAIAGCLRKLGQEFGESFQGGFVCGLPLQKFHESLLWQPLGVAARRECNCDNHVESPHQHLPSWSWCGWECELDL